jgi:hypothetical protein
MARRRRELIRRSQYQMYKEQGEKRNIQRSMAKEKALMSGAV